MRFVVLLSLVAAAMAMSPAEAPASSGIKIPTVQDFVNGLCPEIKAASIQKPTFSTFATALTEFAAGPLRLPKGPQVVGAPDNDAFENAFKKLGVTAAQALEDKSLLGSILLEHAFVGVGDKYFNHDGAQVTITNKTIDVQGSQGPVEIVGNAIKCISDSKIPQTLYLLKDVILPGAAAPAPAPVPAPASAGEAASGVLAMVGAAVFAMMA